MSVDHRAVAWEIKGKWGFGGLRAERRAALYRLSLLSSWDLALVVAELQNEMDPAEWGVLKEAIHAKADAHRKREAAEQARVDAMTEAEQEAYMREAERRIGLR